MTEILQHYGIGIIAGFSVGVIITIYFCKRVDMGYINFLSIILFFVWLNMHFIGFINGKEIDVLFNLFGFFCTGTLLGVRVSDNLIDMITTKIKKGQEK